MPDDGSGEAQPLLAADARRARSAVGGESAAAGHVERARLPELERRRRGVSPARAARRARSPLPERDRVHVDRVVPEVERRRDGPRRARPGAPACRRRRSARSASAGGNGRPPESAASAAATSSAAPPRERVAPLCADPAAVLRIHVDGRPLEQPRDLVGRQLRVGADEERGGGRDLRRRERRTDPALELERPAARVRRRRRSRVGSRRSGSAGRSRRSRPPAPRGRRTARRGSSSPAPTRPGAAQRRRSRAGAPPGSPRSSTASAATASRSRPRPRRRRPSSRRTRPPTARRARSVSRFASTGSRTPPMLRLITRAPCSTAQ